MNFNRLVKSIRFYTFFDQMKRAEYARKIKLFHNVGKNVRLPAMLIPLHSELISFHDNIEIASGVKFVVHDAIHGVLNIKYHGQKETPEFGEQIGCIEIMDNVFIGAGTIILGNVRIGPNVVIGANSLITKDIPEGKVYAGSPAKQIGTFESLVEKRKKVNLLMTADERWQAFANERIQ